MFFVNAIDGNKGPTGRGMMNGNRVFITLGDESKYKGLEKKYVEAFVVAHEIGHNLGLKHAIDHPNEISAYMFSEFFKSKYNSREPFQETNESSKKNTRLFIEWNKTDMK
tara:strand:+ start:272 stop:601 length:330 start_codon:yes stop_codon:yes gene_type:complete